MCAWWWWWWWCVGLGEEAEEEEGGGLDPHPGHVYQHRASARVVLAPATSMFHLHRHHPHATPRSRTQGIHRAGILVNVNRNSLKAGRKANNARERGRREGGREGAGGGDGGTYPNPNFAAAARPATVVRTSASRSSS